MTDRLMSAIGTLAALLIVPLVGWAIVWGVIKEPAIVGSFATAAGAVAAIAVQRDRENRREVAQRHREQLAPPHAQGPSRHPDILGS